VDGTPEKPRLILWSGGCDSTLLLFDSLVSGKDVRTIAVNHDQVLACPYEKRARRRLIKEFRARGYKFPHCEMTIKAAQRGITLGDGAHGLAQPNIWLFAGTGYLNDGEELAVAYIRGDDIWHYMEWYKYAFTYLLAINMKSCDLVFPLEWMDKGEIVTKLKLEGLFEHVWYCELPRKDGRRCGKCASCKRMKNADK